MRISPIDIQQQQFKSRPFGYEKSGVDQFLEMLAEELERLIRKNQDLQEELAKANASLAEMREREETLKETLVTTQKVTDELRSTARREVDVMMAEAEIKAERLMHNAEERRLQLIEEIQEIKRQKVDFEVSLRSLLEKHIRMIDLNTVAIEQQDEQAKLLEEPLPFIQETTQKPVESEATPISPPQEGDPVEEAEFTQPQTEAAGHQFVEPQVPDLSFEFDLSEDEDEEDFLK